MRSQSVKFDLEFRISIPLFKPLSFLEEATYRFRSNAFGAVKMELCSPQIWCNLTHPGSGVDSGSLQKNEKSSINQQRIVRFRYSHVQS